MSFDPASVVRDYGDPQSEAAACRATCALFDYSFVARGRVAGPAALAALSSLTARRLDDMAPGQIRYAVRTDAEGHLVADLTVWRHADGSFEVMSGRRGDIADLVRAAAPGPAADLSGEGIIFAVQGPDALRALAAAGFATAAVEALSYYRFAETRFQGVACLAGRLGYTGEAGFEIVAPSAVAPELWSKLAEIARPAGFAAADILRIEAGFVLFANEFQLAVTPPEAGLGHLMPGTGPARASEAIGPGGQPLALVAFAADCEVSPVLWQPAVPPPRPARRGEIAITSACLSPAAGRVLGLGYVLAEDAEGGGELTDPTGSFSGVSLVSRPFVDPEKRRPRAPWR